MSELRTVRKHSNRRLYYPDGKRYITLADIHLWVVAGVHLNAIDVDSRSDVTCDLLFQVMAAQEQSAAPSLTRDFLLEVIRSGASLPRRIVATFLEQSMNLFKFFQGTRAFQEARKNRGNEKKGTTPTAHRLAEANYQRWRANRRQISRKLANSRPLYCSVAGRRSKMIVAIPDPGPTQRSKRSPRPPTARSRR